MKRPLSQLIYDRFQEGTGSPRVITLHREIQYARDVREYGLAAAPGGRVIGLESYKGVYVGRTVVGYTWFVGPLDAPSPSFFGDALAEIERFLWDEVDRQGGDSAELPFLVGVEQGAIMALAAAAAVPDLLSGIIAIEPTFPVVPGWQPPLAPLDSLPVMLVDRPQTRPSTAQVLAGKDLAATFSGWGAQVERVVSDEGIPAATMARFVAAHPPRHRMAGE